MERILITGGAGFIGHHLVSKLLHQRQYRIIVVDNLSTGRKENLFGNESGSVVRGPHLSFYEENILNSDSIFDIFKHEGVDTCIHLAANTSVLDSATNPYCTVDVNIKGTLNVLAACYRHGVKNINAALMAEFSLTSQHQPDNQS